MQATAKKPEPLYAQTFQFREALFRLCPNWVRTFPEGKLAVHLIAQAFNDNATWFFSKDNELFSKLCDNLGLNAEQIAHMYRQTSRRYALSFGMRYF